MQQQEDTNCLAFHITTCLTDCLVDDVIALVIDYDDAFIRRFDHLYPQTQATARNGNETGRHQKHIIMNDPEIQQIIDLCASLGAKGREFDMKLRPRGFPVEEEIIISHQFYQGPFYVKVDTNIKKNLELLSSLSDFPSPEEDTNLQLILDKLHKAFNNQVFTTFHDIEKHVTLIKLYELCNGDPTGFFLYNYYNSSLPQIYIRCPRCKSYCVSNDRILSDGSFNPLPPTYPSSMAELEADQTGNLWPALQFQEASGYTSPCRSCQNVRLEDYCNIMHIQASEQYSRLEGIIGSLMGPVMTYATIIPV